MSLSVNSISGGATAVMSSPYVSAQRMQVARVGSSAQTGIGRVPPVDSVSKTFGRSEDKIEISAAGRKALEQIYASRSAQKTAQAAPVEAAPAAAEAAALNLQTAAPAAEAAPVEASAPVAASEPAAPVKPVEAVQPSPAKPAAAAEKADAEEFKLDLPGAATQDEAAQELAQVEETIKPLAADESSVSSADLESMSVSEMRTLVNDGTITRADMDRELSRREKASQQSEKQSEAVSQAVSKANDSMKDVSNMTGKMSTYNATKQYAAMAQALA